MTSRCVLLPGDRDQVKSGTRLVKGEEETLHGEVEGQREERWVKHGERENEQVTSARVFSLKKSTKC